MKLLFAVAWLTACCLPVASSLPFFLPDHPYVPPVFQEYKGKNISLQRGPCPGLNTLANHGYINRNGTGISLRDISEASEMVYGTDPAILLDIAVGFIANGMTITQSNGSILIDLFDLYNHDRPEHDASMVRQDVFFEELGQFDETLFDEMLQYAFENGTISLDNLFQFRVDRIHHSRIHNPEFFVSDASEGSIAVQMLLLFAFADDPLSELVEVDNLRSFLQYNKLPDGHVPIQEKGLPGLSLDVPEINAAFITNGAKIREAINGPLNDDTKWREGKLAALIVPLSFTIIMSFLALLHWYTRQPRGEDKSSTSDVKEALAEKNEEVSYLEEKSSPSSHQDSEMVDEFGGQSKDGVDVGHGITWSGVTLSTKKTKKIILNNVTGAAPAGNVTGLMGHSGSGKSSLLSVLRGRHDDKMDLKGSVVTTHVMQSDLNREGTELAYVSQEDSFVTTVTVRESIRFSARMRLPKTRSNDYVEDLTDQIINDLGLKHIKDTCLNNKSGASGGEKRRVSLGLALVVQPKILLLDEVTSGLDSASASRVVQVCSWLAKKNGTAILMSIHQPSSKIFNHFDNVILLARGRCMFNLPTKEVAPFFFANGFEVPEGFSTAEWVGGPVCFHFIATKDSLHDIFWVAGSSGVAGLPV